MLPIIFALVAILVLAAVIIAFIYAYRQRKAARPFGPIAQNDERGEGVGISMNMPRNDMPLTLLRYIIISSSL